MYFLNIYKQKGITSFDVIYKLRKILNIKKIGHAGTLDPLAQGVMQVAVGDAARLLDYLPDTKVYLADIKFGYNSTTCDNEGEKTFIKTPNFTKEALIEALNTFGGKIEQVPPEYSAIKVGGKKLCDLARKGKQIPEIKPRCVEIFEIRLEDFNNTDSAKLYIKCSKGTYIRSIARDLGKLLGCGAYLEDLTRTRAGNFTIDESHKIDENIAAHAINPIDALEFDKIELNETQYKRVINGNPISCEKDMPNSKQGQKFMLIFNNKLVSIANLSDNILKMEKVFNSGV